MRAENVTIIMARASAAPREKPQAAFDAAAHCTCARLDVASERPAVGVAAPMPQPAFPPVAAQAANLLHAAVAFVGDGCGSVDDAQYRRRLEICQRCDRRTGNRCAPCGCWINVKARGRVFRCPIGQWQ